MSAQKEKTLSPMMQHYRDIKSEYPDTILMYRLGDFYEMFYEDAIEASKLLDLTLTGRDCGLEERAPMCGVPYHAVDNYIAKLVKCGKKVAICEQLTAPGDQKGIVKRDVTRVITAGTVTDDEMLDASKNCYLVSVAASGKTIGVAWADVSTGEVKVAELTKSKSLEDYLLSLAPSEIIADPSAFALLKNTESVSVGKLPSPQSYYGYAFDADNARNTVNSFYGVYTLASLGLTDGVLVNALGGLLDYISNTQKRKLTHIRTPKIVRDDDKMFLDYNTRRNLELTETIFDHSKVGSLYWVMDKTRTNMGTRLLRKTINEPFRKQEDIQQRLDAVEDLVTHSRMRESLGDALGSVRDIERLCNKLAYNTLNPREAQAICFSLERIPEIVKALSTTKSKMLVTLRDLLNPLTEIASKVMKAFVDTPPTTLKEGGVFRTGCNAELDKLRSAKSSAKKWLAEYEAREKEETGIKQLKIGYNRVFGYYIEVSKSNLDHVPYRFERKQTLANGERYITDELKKMEEIILGAEEKALDLEALMFAEVKSELAAVVPTLQTNSVAIAEIDLIYSLAVVAVTNNYCKPKVSSQNKNIVIKDGRHPVVEALKRRNEFVANDTVLTDDSNILIITGPNMAGKSTYMRQVALIVLMAHMGSYVPAAQAEIGIVDRVFTRVGASDNVAYGQSTFMVEMTEMANILNNATSDSLLILDEIGRGTSTLDGLSIAWAIVEHIAFKLHAKTLFATHYHELSELEKSLPGLKNYHVLIKDTGGDITFLYKVARGGANKSFGIEVASLAGIDKKIIDRANGVMSAIEENSEGSLNTKILQNPSENAVPTTQIGMFENDDKYNELASILNDIDIESITPMQALTILSNLQRSVKPIGSKRKK